MLHPMDDDFKRSKWIVVVLHPMDDDDFTSIWMLVIYIQQGRSWRMKLSTTRRRRRRRRQAEFSEKDVVVVHERDVREGREAGSNGSHSCNVFEKRPQKKKGRLKKGSHGTQLLEGGELGALSTTLRQLQSATSGFALFRAEAYLGWAWLFPVCNRGEHLHVSKMGIASLRHV